MPRTDWYSRHIPDKVNTWRYCGPYNVPAAGERTSTSSGLGNLPLGSRSSLNDAWMLPADRKRQSFFWADAAHGRSMSKRQWHNSYPDMVHEYQKRNSPRQACSLCARIPSTLEPRPTRRSRRMPILGAHINPIWRVAVADARPAAKPQVPRARRTRKQAGVGLVVGPVIDHLTRTRRELFIRSISPEQRRLLIQC